LSPRARKQRKRITIVIGTRPELIKLVPVIRALEAREGIALDVVFTGQHRELLDELAVFFGISPDHRIDIPGKERSLTALTSALLEGIDAIYCRTFPDLVICQGDTTSAMAAAMAAYHRGVEVAHIEAGLRSGNLQSPYPEEGNRRTIGGLATYHFAPTTLARDNLLAEGVDKERVFVTGNTVLDALREVCERDDLALPNELEGRPYILLTLHRRENLKRFDEILAGVGAVASRYPDLTFAWPVHPNPLVRAGAEALLSTTPNVTLLPPLDYGTFVHTMKHARLILTDSGGVQEEAPALGVPVLVVRDETERTEGLRAGAATLAGTDARKIFEATTRLLDRPSPEDATPRSLYGDGDAARRIVEVLVPSKKPRKLASSDSQGSDLTNT